MLTLAHSHDTNGTHKDQHRIHSDLSQTDGASMGTSSTQEMLTRRAVARPTMVAAVALV